MAKYVDGYVLTVPKKKLEAYRRLAQQAGKVWKKHGALDYKECIGDDLRAKWSTLRFPQMVRLKPGELVVFSFIVFKSRAHRDQVNAKVMKDPLMDPPKDKKNKMMQDMPFDMKRMAYGGFTVLVDK